MSCTNRKISQLRGTAALRAGAVMGGNKGENLTLEWKLDDEKHMEAELGNWACGLSGLEWGENDAAGDRRSCRGHVCVGELRGDRMWTARQFYKRCNYKCQRFVSGVDQWKYCRSRTANISMEVYTLHFSRMEADYTAMIAPKIGQEKRELG